MKKKKFLATILIASSAFLGTGYSWWTDGLKLGGVVSTGEFKVVGVEGTITTKGSDKSINTSDMSEETKSGIEGFSYLIDDLYPYKSYRFTAKFENQGSIPAKIADIEITKEATNISKKKDDDNVFNHLKVTGTVKVVSEDASSDSNGKYPAVDASREYILEDDATIGNLEGKLEREIKGWQLDEKQSIIFEDCKVKLIKARYEKDENEENERNVGEGSEVKFNLKMSFKQHNQ